MIRGFDKELFTKRISVKNLKAGDILAHDVYLTQGTLVAKAGVELSESHLEKLRRMGDRIVVLDQRKLYLRGIRVSKQIMLQAARDGCVYKSDVDDLMEPFIEEVKREKNIFALLEQLKSKDEYSFQHTINIGILSYIFGEWCGYKGEDLHRLTIAGTLHDIGKSKIPPAILNKPGPLTEQEYEIMKTHSQLGYEILKNSSEYDEDVQLAVLHHHEREDGSGYPFGLKADEIHPFAKIIAVADIYHAMTTDRVYRQKDNTYSVLGHLKRNLYNLDVKIINTVINKMLSYLQGCKVVMNNGRIGDVIYINQEALAYPIIKTSDGEIIDLSKNSNVKIIDIIYDLASYE